MVCEKTKLLKIIPVIPARGGSKRLPRKNVLDLNGKPLIAYSIEAGLDSSYIDKVVVTSDDIYAFKMNRENSIDIDEKIDFKMAEVFLKGLKIILIHE